MAIQNLKSSYDEHTCMILNPLVSWISHTLNDRSCIIWFLDIFLTSFPTILPLMHFLPVTLAFLLIVEHAKYTVRFKDLAFVLSSWKALSPDFLWLVPLPPSDIAQMSLSQRCFIYLLYLPLHPPPYFLSYPLFPAVLCFSTALTIS